MRQSQPWYMGAVHNQINQSLRDTVNAYYTHTLNDPNMSTEDALKSTGEMAKKYLSLFLLKSTII